MSRPLPKNLERVYQMIGKQAVEEMHGGYSFEVDGVEFVAGYAPESTADRFYIVKSQNLIGYYDAFLSSRPCRNVFELGIAEGGSVALLALRDDTEIVVAIDNEEHRLPALDDFIEARGLAHRVHAHYGVDQGDRSALLEIVDRDFHGEDLDVVIDDASHQYDLTRSSFDILFPRLRPGGWYVVEDWDQNLRFAEGIRLAVAEKGAPAPPADTSAGPPKPEVLDRMAFEWVAAMGASSAYIDRLEMNDEFIAARRGPAVIDPLTFSLDALTAAEASLGILSPRPV